MKGTRFEVEALAYLFKSDDRPTLNSQSSSSFSRSRHAVIMGVQSFSAPEHMGHLMGDVPALLLVAVVLSVLATAPAKQPAT